MKRKINTLLAVVLTLFAMTVLTACSGTTITSNPKGVTFEFEKLTEDDVNETTEIFLFDDALLTVSLESGTANVQICSIVPVGDIDDDIFDEIGTIYEGEGLKDGDQIEINGVRGDIVIRVWGNAGKGTIKIAKK